jgi:hypothetical protein
MVLAIGILLDLDKPAHSAEAMSYYHLARAALSIDSVLDVQTIAGIQALVNFFDINWLIFSYTKNSYSCATSCFCRRLVDPDGS